MSGRFIYVFDEGTKDKLIAVGFMLLKSSNGIYIFENKSELKFEMNGMCCLYSDTLTF